MRSAWRPMAPVSSPRLPVCAQLELAQLGDELDSIDSSAEQHANRPHPITPPPSPTTFPLPLIPAHPAAMTQEMFDEICEYFSLADDCAEGDSRALTFRGFYELYAMQTSADEDESWKDLEKWGYGERLVKRVEELVGEGEQEES